MLFKCCTQYVSKFGKLSRGHRTGKGQFLFQSQRKTMPKNVQTTTQIALISHASVNSILFICSQVLVLEYNIFTPGGILYKCPVSPVVLEDFGFRTPLC